MNVLDPRENLRQELFRQLNGFLKRSDNSLFRFCRDSAEGGCWSVD